MSGEIKEGKKGVFETKVSVNVLTEDSSREDKFSYCSKCDELFYRDSFGGCPRCGGGLSLMGRYNS